MTRAELIATGSELLRFGRSDGNGDWLTRRLNALGVEVVSRSVVEDDAEVIAGKIRSALSADLVLVTGGLGPTEDDRTREALARVVDRPLERDPRMVERLRAWFSERGRSFHELQERQADRPAGFAWLDNPVGTAPGLFGSVEGCSLFAVPGVPEELYAIFEASILPRLEGRGRGALALRMLRVAGRTESSVDEQLAGLHRVGPVEITLLTGSEGIEIHLRASGGPAPQLKRSLDRVEGEIVRRLGADLYGRGEESLPGVVGELLTASGSTVSTAESCTAGLIAAALTEVPGSSRWFRGGLIVYDDELKGWLAGVSEGALAAHGAVSRPVAEELARGARERCRTTYGLGVTGIAGPGGGTAEKPVGLVHLALAGPADLQHRELRMIGDRSLVRRRMVTAALDTLRRRLL